MCDATQPPLLPLEWEQDTTIEPPHRVPTAGPYSPPLTWPVRLGGRFQSMSLTGSGPHLTSDPGRMAAIIRQVVAGFDSQFKGI